MIVTARPNTKVLSSLIVLFGSITVCCAHNAEALLQYFIKNEQMPRNVVNRLEQVPRDLTKVAGFDSLVDADQERLLFIARDATCLYAEEHDKRYWHGREAEYCQQWIDWYSEKQSSGGYVGTEAVPPKKVEEHYVNMIGYLGEAFLSAGEYDKVCDHFARYSKIAVPRLKWLKTWGNALVENQGSPWHPGMVDISLVGRTKSSPARQKKEVLSRWTEFCEGLAKFIAHLPKDQRTEWDSRLNMIRNRINTHKLPPKKT